MDFLSQLYKNVSSMVFKRKEKQNKIKIKFCKYYVSFNLFTCGHIDSEIENWALGLQSIHVSIRFCFLDHCRTQHSKMPEIKYSVREACMKLCFLIVSSFSSLIFYTEGLKMTLTISSPPPPPPCFFFLLGVLPSFDIKHAAFDLQAF